MGFVKWRGVAVNLLELSVWQGQLYVRRQREAGLDETWRCRCNSDSLLAYCLKLHRPKTMRCTIPILKGFAQCTRWLRNSWCFQSVCINGNVCRFYQWQSSSRAYIQQSPHSTTHHTPPHERINSWSVVCGLLIRPREPVCIYISFVFYSMLIYFGTGEYFYEIYGCLYINPLSTKHRLFYLKTQFVPRCKHFSSRL